MKKEIKLVLAALAVVAGTIGLVEACSSCGCSAKKEKKADTTCDSGVCGIIDAAQLEQAAAHSHELSTEKMKAAVKSGKYIILDARGGTYFNGELIPGAKHLSVGSDDAAIKAAAPDKNAKIITYCSNTKCPASGKLAEKLIALGYTNVNEYPEGLAGWKAAGEKTAK